MANWPLPEAEATSASAVNPARHLSHISRPVAQMQRSARRTRSGTILSSVVFAMNVQRVMMHRGSPLARCAFFFHSTEK